MNLTQQVLLRDAMRRLNMTREVFADRIGTRRRALDSWLLPDDSSEFRAMPEMARRYVLEILERQAPATASTQSVHDVAQVASSGHHLLSVSQFNRESLEHLFHVADVMQPIAHRRKVSRVLEGAVLANLFFEASTRTRISFGAAFCRLGGSVCDTTGFTFSSMAKGESLRDTAMVISGYADAIVVRHPEQGSVAEFASATNIPVINAGDGAGEHPSQALLDVYTIQREFSRLGKLVDGAHIAMVGDLKYGRTVHSLIQLLALFRRVRFTLVSPPSLRMPRALVEAVAARGHEVVESGTLDSLADADVVYATRIQKERFSGESVESYGEAFRIDRALVERVCGPDAVLMHPLPRDGRPGANDLSTDLDRDPRLAIFRQTDNGIPVRMAIFSILMGVDGQVQRSMRDVRWQPPAAVRPDDALLLDLE
ncbi:aspartate carbamoyltransferase [Variovorax sp. JS1663]|uniref:aspartate carbamoyltransferase n=1 Tax=Variovorax sp. JS1663 TaxID=1851577 RepID=UPI000B342E38|nr:aspartate carbamoyltransferase [Variovorax sp. JS1663]OUL98087.1 aspartate carbamoyltransferase [Variovorax sp. JS1663]